MAEGEEKKSGGGGGDGKKGEFPTGFRFKPTDEELVEYYLLPRLQSRPSVPNDAVIEANVYECQPDRLINEMYKDRGENDWYFLSPRARKYQNGDRPSRNTDDGLGRWKASTGKKEAEEAVCDGQIKFCKSTLAYFQGPIKTEKKTKWLMQELTVPQYENKLDKSGKSGNSKTLDDYVMCRIYVTPKGKGNDEEASSSSACGQACSSSSQPGPVESGQGTAGPGLSERQAGKRTVEEQPRGRATVPKRARQPTLTLGPTPVYGGMQGPSRTAGQHGGTGQPMVYNCHSPMPRTPAMMYDGQVPRQQPPVMYNVRASLQRPPAAHNGQAPMQRPPAAYNGQVAYNGKAQMQRPPAAHNGQAAMQRPPVAYNGQVAYNGKAQMQRPPVEYNGQAPVQRSPMAYNGQGQMQRPPVEYNGQAPVHRSPVAYNGQAQMQRLPVEYNGEVPMNRSPVAYDGQTPMQQPPVGYNGQAQMQRLPSLMSPHQAAAAHGSFGQIMMMPLRPSTTDADLQDWTREEARGTFTKYKS